MARPTARRGDRGAPGERVACSPDGAQRNPGRLFPHCATLHAGYKPPRNPDMLSIENLRKVFQASGHTEVRAVDGINLSVERGRLLTLLGPSGCGKTTTLRCLAGLERPDSGRIVIGDTTVFDSA